MVQNKNTWPVAFILHKGGRNNKEIISANYLKRYIENQNHENLLITTEMCKEAGYKGICNNNSITKQLCDNNFINCGSMTETQDEIDEFNQSYIKILL